MYYINKHSDERILIMITFGVKNLHGEIRRNVEESKFQMLRAHQRARALASLAGGKLAAPWLERSRILHISPSENARDTEDMHHRVGGVRTPSVWKLVLLREPSRPKAERPFETFASTSTRVLRRGSSFPALSLSLSLILCPRDIFRPSKRMRWPR